MLILLGRPAYMSVDLCFTTDSSASFLIRPLISKLAEWNSTISGHMVGSAIWYCMSEIWGSLPLQIGGPKTTFLRWFRNLRTNLTADVFGIKHDIHKRASALQATRGLLHHLETTWTLVHKRLQIRGELSLTLHKFCIPLHCQALQIEISKRNSTKLCQTVDGRSR